MLGWFYPHFLFGVVVGGEGVGQEAFLEKLGQDTNITILYLRGSGVFLGGDGGEGEWVNKHSWRKWARTTTSLFFYFFGWV